MKSRVKFGIDIRKQLTGADLYVRIFQICALLPLPYLYIAMIDHDIGSSRNLLSVLFDIGMSSIPRGEAFAMSFLYRTTLSEEKVYFIILVIAIVLGFAADRVLRGNPALSVRMHKLFAVLVACDLVIRIIPVKANIAFGLPAAIAGFVIRAVCLWLIVLDLKVHKAETEAEKAVQQ